MQLDMMTVQGPLLGNVGASEALLQLPENMKLNPLLCGWVSPMLETLPRGRQSIAMFESAPAEVLLLLVDGPPGRGSVVMADI